MAFYDDMAAVALNLLTQFGQSVTLVRTTGKTIDPVTGAVVAGSDASVTTTGLFKKYPESLIDGERIMVGDREVILSNEQVPLSTDKITHGGEDWSVVNINTVSPAGTPVVYFVQVRR